MAFTIEKFTSLRPYLYHLTYGANLNRIRRESALVSAATLLRAANDPHRNRERRKGAMRVRVDGDTVVIRDQDPLHKGAIDFMDGFTFEELVQFLNGFVFFWPGTDKGPSEYGKRHFERYAKDDSFVIRVPTAAMLQANQGAALFSKYNSGAPRCSNGKHTPRGKDTFIAADRADFIASEVVEVVFRAKAGLPSSAQVGKLTDSINWKKL